MLQQSILFLDILAIIGVIGLIIYLFVSSKPMKFLGQSRALASLALLISFVNILYVLIFSNEILTYHSSVISQKTWDDSILQLSAVFAMYVIGTLIMFISSIMLFIQIRYERFL
ncbi:hypothetical protein KDAU_70810 [Dictyobacter aurantiacus]|uniref:Uncharacterized protein n=1 Tax=Dictyobacter aurantiacus TaxID=1936993 RepID=A0A401ZSG8_9CHLR|nr:hypothetical protein KDAU_70810 [Dictyobacter aurantiacus]